MPDGVFNNLSSFTSMEQFERLHCLIDSNKSCKSHWTRNFRQYEHNAEPLFSKFTSIDALRLTIFLRNIDARGWELHLRDSKSSSNQTEYFFHSGCT